MLLEIGVLVDEYVFILKCRQVSLAKVQNQKRGWSLGSVCGSGKREAGNVGLSQIIKDHMCHPGHLAIFSLGTRELQHFLQGSGTFRLALGWALLWLFGGTQVECGGRGASVWSDLMQRAWGYIRKTWVWVLVLLLSSCVTLVKGCSFSRASAAQQWDRVTVPTFQGGCENSVPDIHHLYHMLLLWQMLRKCYFLPILFLYLYSCPSSNAWNSLLCSEIFPIGPFFLRWLCGVYLVHYLLTLTSTWH